MKKIILYLFVFTLALSTVFACISCSSENVDNPTEDTTAPVTEKKQITIFENNAFNTVIVYPHDAPNLIEDTAFGLSYSLLGATGGIFPQVISDKEYEGIDTSDISMILIGKTSIPGTESAFENTCYGTTYTRICGNKYQVVLNDKEESTAFLDKFKELLGNTTLSTLVFDETWEFSVANDTALNALPLYDNCYAEETVDCGDGAYMKVVPSTDKDGFEAYIEKVIKSGYDLYTRNEIGDNSFATLTTDGYVMNAMYLPVRNEVRLIIEPEGITSLPPLEDENNYDVICSSSVTQMGLENGEDYQNGMCYIFKLDDGRFVVIDGGFKDRYVLDKFLETIHSLAENPGDISIAAWFITHLHDDHWELLEQIAHNPDVNINVERIICNFPDQDFINKTELIYMQSNYYAAMTIFKDNGTKIVKAHPGQVFHIVNMKFTVYGTAEMLSLEKTTNVNDTSLLIHATADGQTFLFPGDSADYETSVMMELYGKHLKADFLQVIHHGYSGGDSGYYEFVDPQIVFWPVGMYDYQYGPKMLKDSEYSEYFFRKDTSIKEIFLAGDTVVTLPLPYDEVTAAN